MATPPDFTTGQVLTAAQMNAVGLWLVKSQAVGTGVSSVQVTSCFTADYNSYKIVYSGGTGSANNHLALKFGATTTGYYGGLVYNNVASPAPAGVVDNNAAAFTYAAGGNAVFELANIDVHNPFIAAYTLVNAWNMSFINFGSYNGYLANTTTYSDFTLTPNSGTLTGGTISVYGYRK